MITESPLIIENNSNPQAVVIWLHGLGADGHDFEDLVRILEVYQNHPVRFVLPHAPIRSITINAGMRMRGWYDIIELSGQHEDRQGLEQSRQVVHELIEQQTAQGIPSEKIVLAGFSQGAAVTLYSASRIKQRLAALIALSGYLPFSQEPFPNPDPNQGIALLMVHGIYDPVLPFAMAETSLHKIGDHYQTQWYPFEMQHEVCVPEIKLIDEFLMQQLGFQ